MTSPIDALVEALEPCPFCGGEAEMDASQAYTNFFNKRTETGIAIFCRDCGVQQMVCRGDVPDIEPEQVIALWNRRATPKADGGEREAVAAEVAGAMNAYLAMINHPTRLAAGDDIPFAAMKRIIALRSPSPVCGDVAGALERLQRGLDDFDRENAADLDADDFNIGQDEAIEVSAADQRVLLSLVSAFPDRSGLGGNRHD